MDIVESQSAASLATWCFEQMVFQTLMRMRRFEVTLISEQPAFLLPFNAHIPFLSPLIPLAIFLPISLLQCQPRVLSYGIAGAVVFRAIMIFLGITALDVSYTYCVCQWVF